MERARAYDDWVPHHQDGMRFVTAEQLEPGTVVVWDFKPLFIDHTEEVNFANWPDDYVKRWKAAGEPDPATWDRRPIYIHNRADRTKDPLRLGNASARYQFLVLPEHYAVCSCCGEIPPCRAVFHDQVAAVESRRIEFEMTLTIGCCHACGERVYARDNTVLFPGDNLVRPDLGPNSAVFHRRAECFPVLLAYQDRWLAADSSREPRLPGYGRAGLTKEAA